MQPSLRRHKVLKVIRWALYLSAFTYRIEQVPGDSNTWTDIMTRLMQGYRKPPSICKVAPVISFCGVTASPDSNEFKWPNTSEILDAQKKYKQEAPKNATQEKSNLFCINGAAWIPNDAVDLKLLLLTIAHAGSAGRRVVYPTWHSLRNEFTWADQRDDVRSFVSACLLCLMTKSGEMVPRPLSNTLHAMKPNEIIHFDYLFPEQSDDDNKYALVVKDDLSSYVWLDPSPVADAEHAAAVLARWNRIFTAPDMLVSDQGFTFQESSFRAPLSVSPYTSQCDRFLLTLG